MAARALTCDLVDSTGTLPEKAAAWVRAKAVDAGALLRATGEVRVRVIDDAEMAAAHLRYAGVEGTTDVLTFDLSDAAERPEKPTISVMCQDFNRSLYVLDADILVCLDEAGRRARAGGYAVERELLLYVVHGVLHCLGWNDHDEAEACDMHRLEDEVLSGIGVGAVYGV